MNELEYLKEFETKVIDPLWKKSALVARNAAQDVVEGISATRMELQRRSLELLNAASSEEKK